jgi:hypothetical protein
MDIAEALDLGREYGQHSIFVINASTRKVTRCSDGETLWFAPRTSS